MVPVRRPIPSPSLHPDRRVERNGAIRRDPTRRGRIPTETMTVRDRLLPLLRALLPTEQCSRAPLPTSTAEITTCLRIMSSTESRMEEECPMVTRWRRAWFLPRWRLPWPSEVIPTTLRLPLPTTPIPLPTEAPLPTSSPIPHPSSTEQALHPMWATHRPSTPSPPPAPPPPPPWWSLCPRPLPHRGLRQSALPPEDPLPHHHPANHQSEWQQEQEWSR